MSDGYAALETAAQTLGADHGRAAGSWVIDGNTSVDTARAIVQGYEDGDPQVMDMQPSPLSGEWAGDPTIADILREIADTLDFSTSAATVRPVIEDDWQNDLLDAYELAYSDAYWSEVIRAAKVVLGDE